METGHHKKNRIITVQDRRITHTRTKLYTCRALPALVFLIHLKFSKEQLWRERQLSLTQPCENMPRSLYHGAIPVNIYQLLVVMNTPDGWFLRCMHDSKPLPTIFKKINQTASPWKLLRKCWLNTCDTAGDLIGSEWVTAATWCCAQTEHLSVVCLSDVGTGICDQHELFGQYTGWLLTDILYIFWYASI